MGVALLQMTDESLLRVLLERIARERANARDPLVLQCLDRIEGKR